MNTQSAIRKVFAAAAISTAIGLTSLVGGAASADGSKPGTEVHYYTITLTNANVANTGVAQGQLTSAPATPQTISFVFEKIPITYGTR
jgi:hypothetical protein